MDAAARETCGLRLLPNCRPCWRGLLIAGTIPRTPLAGPGKWGSPFAPSTGCTACCTRCRESPLGSSQDKAQTGYRRLNPRPSNTPARSAPQRLSEPWQSSRHRLMAPNVLNEAFENAMVAAGPEDTGACGSICTCAVADHSDRGHP